MTATSLPRVPEGLRDLMKVYTKEVLREKPSDLYGFSANFFNLIVGDKSHQPVRKFEPVQTYETIMKNRIRQQVPISMVFNMIPETLTDLIKQFIKAVLREKPENIYIFAQEYFQRLSKEKSGRVEYTKYATYEKSLKDKENVAPVSKVTCECGRILSANTKGVDSSVTLSNTSTSDINQKNTLGNVNYLKSVLIIQRQIRRYLKRKKISRKKDKCNSLEYMTSILLIQRQVRRYLAKRRLEKLKVLRSQQPKAKLDTANYMKAVIVIQRHYRIYLKKKQEQNRLKSGTVSLATAAIIIQKAFRRMVARNRAKRNASASTDQAEELNDNGSETGSYTSVSTALLSTESTELGGLNYEERVHQKIIHEDEEVENNNVDAGLEKEYFAKAITGGEKSMHLRKRVEDMLSKSNNDSTESEVEVKKQPETEIEDEFTANKTKNDIKLENDSELKANTDAQLEKEDNLEATKAMDDSKSEKIPIIETSKPIEEKELKNAGDLDLKSEKEAVVKSERAVDDPVSEEASKIIINQVVTKDDVTEDSTAKEKEDSSAESGNGKNAEISSSINNEEVNVSEKKNDDLEEPISKKIEDSPDESGKDEKDQIPSNEVIPLPKIINSDSQLEKVPTLSLVTPTISIEHVENLPQEEEEQILTPSNINDSTKDALSEKELIESTDPATPTSSQDEVVISKNNSLEKNPSDSEVSPSTEEVKTPETDSSEKITKAAEVSTLSREKRSLEEPETDLDKSNEKSMTEDLAKQESIKKDDDTEDIPLTNLNQLSQEEIQEGNEEKSKLELSKAASLAEEIPQADVNIEESSKPEIKTDNAQKDIGLRDINAANSQDSNKPEVQKNSSLLVSNQLIGTQNLPTNHIEIEKTTKKYSSGNVREIGTVSSGRLVPTPIAELQLKSFKTPNDDGAWYDIYVEPQSTSDKDIEINAATVEGGKPEMDQPKEVVEEPITVLERVPSYYTPKEMVQPEEPKPKNSISFYVSFDSDDDKPKYKIPKRFRNDPKKDSVKTKEIDVKNSNESEALTADSDADINDEDIEMIDVVEGDLEYQQVGSKLQTIIELNENEQPTEIGALQPDIGASADDVKEEGDKESNLESLLAIKTVTENSSDEIEYSSAQNPFSNGNPLQEVVEEPCIKKSASLVNLSEGETEPEVSGKERTDSSLSETTGLDTLSADTIDKATMKLSKPEEMIEKMSQMRESKSQERIKSADPSFDEPVVRTMSLLQEQASLDIEDGDLIVYKRLQRDETRESSAQSDSVVFGDPETETENIQERDLGNEEESSRVHLMRHYTIAGDDPRGLFRSVTIDDALNYTEDLESGRGINSTSSFYLDDETSENIRKKMMAYSLSETDSDYFDPKKLSDEDFDIDTAMADAMGTSTETESTIVSAATKIQAGARGFLTRRRLRRASAGTKSSTQDTKASFGNDAISESLERFIEEEAAKKIQAAYRIHTRKRRGHNRKMEGISLESNLAARRQKLQRGDALRNDSTPDDENSETKSRAAIELKWLTMRQNSMPVQIDCEVFRVIPKHMRKRIKSADSNKRK
ncbi:hypothetical protein KR009_010930 [Drosophila setifemur]|nr:hypothetical protein KR009_010930 [Drosophila setifemur]